MPFRIALLALLALPLVACTEVKEERFEPDDPRGDRKVCVREGFVVGTYEYDKCMERRAIRRDEEDGMM